MEILEGNVTDVRFTPGRGDGMLTLTLQNPDKPDVYADLLLLDKDVQITVDGYFVIRPDSYIDPKIIVTYLYTHRCSAKIHSRGDRYGAATKAEFITLPKEKS